MTTLEAILLGMVLMAIVAMLLLGSRNHYIGH